MSIVSASAAAGFRAAPSPSSAPVPTQIAKSASQSATPASAPASAAAAISASGASPVALKRPDIRLRKQPTIEEQCGFCMEYKVKQDFAMKQWHGKLLPRRCKTCTKVASDARIAAKTFRKVRLCVCMLESSSDEQSSCGK